jgi:hypothetical protein
MESHAVAKVKNERCRIGLFPADRQRWRELEAGVVVDQAVKEKRIDSLRLRVGSNARIEIGGTALNEEDDGLRIARRGMATGKDN